MIDKSIEWLESLYVRRPATPEADMAKDLLERLAIADAIDAEIDELQEAHDNFKREIERCTDEIHKTDALLVPEGLDGDDIEHAIATLAQCCNDLCEALGADSTEEALAMANNMREAFEEL